MSFNIISDENITRASMHQKSMSFRDGASHPKRKADFLGANSKRMALGNVTNVSVQTRSMKANKTGFQKHKTEGELNLSTLGRKPLIREAVFQPTKKQTVAVFQEEEEEKIEVDQVTELEDECELTLEIEEVAVNARPAPMRDLPPGCDYDIDVIHWAEQLRVPEYAQDVIDYLKTREEVFRIPANHMDIQPELTPWMRSVLVDWMVMLQDFLELNHETLYRAVKLLDLYLMKKPVLKRNAEMLTCTALYIMSKFDAAAHLSITGFASQCEGLCSPRDMMCAERSILRTVDFDLGFPDSYTFLRRWWECSRLTWATLMLARFVLEMSLMCYEIVPLSESKVAAAALFIAMKMRGRNEGWTSTMEHYTGYKLEDFGHIVVLLNDNLRTEYKYLDNIREKYSHSTFLRVAKIPLKENHELIN